MKTTVGLALLNKLLARGIGPTWLIAIGNGGSDPTLKIAVAPSLGDVALRKQIYKSKVDEIATTLPARSANPAIEFKNTFYARSVVPSGVAVTAIDELGIFATDPDTSQDVLIDRVTFDPLAFNVPATGRSVSKDALQLTLSWGIQ